MVKSTFLFAAIAATFSALTQTVLADSDVLSLTDKTFDQEVSNQDLMLVEFFAPWCGHCKALAPEYEIAATTLKDKIKLAKVDCTENQDLCQKHGIQGYPTLKVFRGTESTDYKGARKADGIVSYMQKQAAPALADLDATNFTEFKNSDRVVVVGYVKDEESKATLKSVADKMRDDFLFGVVTDEALAKEHEVTFPSVVVYKQFDEGRNDLAGALDADAIKEFVKTSSVPLLDEIDASNFQSYAESGLPLAYIFHDNADDQKRLTEMAAPLAKKYKGKINFVHIDANKYGAHADNLALKQTWPAFGIQHLDSGAKFPLDQSKELTFENLEPFLQDYADGKVKATVKSAEAPADNNGPVKVVVANEFKDIVLDKSKDVFLEVYAPWCGHCKRLAPTWEQLGKAAAEQDPSIVIAKLDGTENDIPEEGGFEITGFPTLKFFKAETNELVDYEGDRSIEDLTEFISKHSSKKTKIVVPKEEEKVAEDKEKEKEPVNTHDEL
ncbi:thioredoxin-like protein [Gilbertella persicaria]|uniref:thioredoxin-like protein n=1 Tax=Gilbertella persicaria TaxID=101096 RepID=UPI00221E7A2D|nr:thioredoxin-like protein [Gilbertella persicaria]KAI8075394.1 thioredoxin-like protein [Gilbertella persicaria]